MGASRETVFKPTLGGRSSSEPSLRPDDIPRVIFLNPWDRLIGPNRYLVEMMRQSPELASRSTVVFPEVNDALGEYERLGCGVAVWPEIRLIHARLTGSNILHLLRNHSRGLARVARGMKSLHPDLVVSNSEILCLGGMAARALGIPHIQVVHSLLFQHRKSLGVPVRAFICFLSFWAQGFVCVSEAVRQMLKTLGVHKWTAVVPNGFDLQEIRNQSFWPLPSPVEDLFKGRHPTLLTVGRISPMKGQNFLVDAVRRLRPIFPSLQCFFVGRRGPPESREDISGFSQGLFQQIKKHNLEDTVHFLGEVDYVPGLLRRADLYVHPSLTESFSRVVAEALILRRPVVCTQEGALPEVVGPQGAFLVPPADGQSLAQGIIQVLQEKSLREMIISSGREHVERHYSARHITRQFIRVLYGAAGRRPSMGDGEILAYPYEEGILSTRSLGTGSGC